MQGRAVAAAGLVARSNLSGRNKQSRNHDKKRLALPREEHDWLADIFDHAYVGFLKSEGFDDNPLTIRMDGETRIAGDRI